MTRENYLESNKTIHEFMGWRWFSKRYPRNHGVGAPEMCDEIVHDVIIEKSKYHLSWDWLMPVVEKINKSTTYDVIIYKTTVHINDWREIIIEECSENYNYNLLLTVYHAVLKFITDYNNNNQ